MLPGKIKVLVADDNKDFNDILSEYLSCQENIEVVATARNGRDAVEQIQATRPDIVLLDMIMPDLDGIGVLQALHGLPASKLPSFIMLSALSNEKLIQSALELGASYYIIKPFDMDILVNKIYQIAGKRASMTETA